MRKRKIGREEDNEGEAQELPPIEPFKTKSPSKKGKSKLARALQKAAGHVSHKRKHRNNEQQVQWSYAFSVKGRSVNEDDLVLKGNEAQGGQVANAIGKVLLLPRDMKVWQEDSSERMLENLKRDSILAGSRLLETERRLRESLEENVWLKAFEKKALATIQATENGRKSAKAGLKTAERQVKEFAEKYDREIERSSKLRGDISALKVEGFDEATNSLKSQLAEECNKYFIQGWRAALDRIGVDDALELYDLGPKCRPFRPTSPQEHEEVGATEGQMDLEAGDGQIPVVEVQEGDGGSDGEETLDVIS
uniref:Uncharacterized protein n=1 Tax=Fagus sylvatica TaxID=28930 RepID=A0A2N9FBA7_FAGSY